MSLLERIQQAQLRGVTELSTPLQATIEGTSSTSTTVVPPTRVAMDTTTLTNLSDLPSLTAKPPLVSRQATAEQILSLDIDEILNSTYTSSHTNGDGAKVAVVGDKTSDKSKTKPTEKKIDDIFSSLVNSSSTVTTGNSKPSRLPSTSLPLPAPDLIGLEDNYGDDFEPLSQEVLPKKYDDVDYTLSNENLSDLSEEITTESSSCLDNLPEGGLKMDKPLLSNELIDNIITSEGSMSSVEVDYNKMAETNYQQRKAEMEKEFKQKQVKPGDPGYVYDKEVKFEPAKMESGWDTDEDVSEF